MVDEFYKEPYTNKEIQQNTPTEMNKESGVINQGSEDRKSPQMRLGMYFKK